MTSSSSSPDLTSILSGRGIIGSKCGPTWSSSVADSPWMPVAFAANTRELRPANPGDDVDAFCPNGLLVRDVPATDWNEHDEMLEESKRNVSSAFCEGSFAACSSDGDSLPLKNKSHRISF